MGVYFLPQHPLHYFQLTQHPLRWQQLQDSSASLDIPAFLPLPPPTQEGVCLVAQLLLAFLGYSKQTAKHLQLSLSPLAHLHRGEPPPKVWDFPFLAGTKRSPPAHRARCSLREGAFFAGYRVVRLPCLETATREAVHRGFLVAQMRLNLTPFSAQTSLLEVGLKASNRAHHFWEAVVELNRLPHPCSAHSLTPPHCRHPYLVM